ncbi:MAG: exodeoxyribonuclease VII small subunit [Firmicutes bacterium]|nr:exodeoxyribonuclease VII small subunit [Candidatus Alectryobacillus merdavium]
MTIEEKFKRLNEIVEEIESNSIDLDKSISLYQEGQALIQDISKQLKEAELKITKIEQK